MSLPRWAAAAAVAWGLGAAPAAAQEGGGPEAGRPAPDFALTAATREGVGTAPVRLSDFKGKTVVLAFFYKARTKG